jgi:hypothetical protein
LSKDFFPFGEKPRLNDALYLALNHPAAFAKTGTITVTVKVELSNPPPVSINPSDDLIVAWEMLTAQGWEERHKSDQGAADDPKNFTASGEFALTLDLSPRSNMAPGLINGESGYWIRARIISGHYGQIIAPGQMTVTTLTADAAADTQRLQVSSVRGFMPGDLVWIALGSAQQEDARIASVDLQTQTLTVASPLAHRQAANTGIYLRHTELLGPPSVKSLKLDYTYDNREHPVPLVVCQSCNDFSYEDQTQAAQPNQPSFSPFKAITDTASPTLYLGFDQPFANRPITLYAQVAPPTYAEATLTQPRTTARLNWEYYGNRGWTRLDVQDDTRVLAERGLLTFMGPKDFIASQQFDQSLYWLRVVWAEGTFQVSPRLQGLRTNTTWASQAVTLQQEILGSSNGNPDQLFHTTKAPVLEGQHLEVQERATTPEPERQTAFTWVAWQPQPDFHGSGPQDRHYVINALTGEVRFGDGMQGKIPPQGRNNVCLTYRTGGGQRGNRDVGTLIQLKSAIPYIDRVINYEAATGGADPETLEHVKQQGPKALRHRGRAVTAQDFEDLAYQASSDVARAKAIPSRSAAEAGQMGLVLVPQSSEEQPIPSLELLNRVADYLRDRCAPTLNLWMAGPDWVKVTVTAEIAPVSWQASRSLDARIIEALQGFLHPLTGGSEGKGWAFGREPHDSDLYALLESIAGVGHVQLLTVDKEPQGSVRRDRFLVCSGSHKISLAAPEAKEV